MWHAGKNEIWVFGKCVCATQKPPDLPFKWRTKCYFSGVGYSASLTTTEAALWSSPPSGSHLEEYSSCNDDAEDVDYGEAEGVDGHDGTFLVHAGVVEVVGAEARLGDERRVREYRPRQVATGHRHRHLRQGTTRTPPAESCSHMGTFHAATFLMLSDCSASQYQGKSWCPLTLSLALNLARRSTSVLSCNVM